MKVLKLKSPGKINLRLDVFDKRPDGYHNIRMLNSAVNVYDDIEIQLVERGVEIVCDNDPLVPLGEDNIAFKACKEIMAYSNKNVGVRIVIKKNIPVASGMGGGSSNAASVIMGLNQMLKINLSIEKLMKIGFRFGSDIPFFMFGAPAVATGIGENLTKVKKMPTMPMVLVNPGVSVPTKSVYEKYQRANSLTPVELPNEFTTKKAVVRVLNNDLERVTTKQVPVVQEIKEMLMKYGALASQMTGSGPIVFGIFPDKEKAEKAAKKVQTHGDTKWRVFVAENV